MAAEKPASGAAAAGSAPNGGTAVKAFGLDRAALMLYLTFPLVDLTAAAGSALALAVFGGRRIRAALLGYLLWAWLLDGSPERGGYEWCWRWGITAMLRRSFFWRWAASYFPCTMQATAPLPADEGPYIFVCHPHGIFGISPMTHFGTEATDFSGSFPGLNVHLLGHSAIFRIPFFREWCLLHGHGSVDRKTCLGLLRRGHSIALAPGGARESLESTPGTMRLFLEKRRGFAKLALQTGAALVPVVAFGENELYSTVQFAGGTWKRRVQERLQRLLGFALPVFCGVRWLPLLPKRRPVHTLVGAPLRPPRPAAVADAAAASPDSAASSPAGEGQPSQEAVAALHGRYCEALRALFEEHKAQHGAAGMQLELV